MGCPFPFPGSGAQSSSIGCIVRQATCDVVKQGLEDDAMKERDETEKRIREIYAARRRGSVEQVMATFAPQARFRLAGNAALAPMTMPVDGHTQLRSVMKQLVDDWDWSDFMIEKIVVDGNQAAVYSRGPMRYGADRQEIETEILDLLTLEDGKIIELVEFCDTHMVSRMTGLGA